MEPRSNQSALTPRQKDIARLIIGNGGELMANKEIAYRLELKEQTVKNHLREMFRKRGVRSKRELAEVCFEELGLRACPECGVGVVERRGKKDGD